MLRLRSLLLAAVLLLGLVPASVASAASDCTSAPGTSAVDQYCEVVPGADGGKPSEGPAAGDNTKAALRALPSGAARQLSGSGPTNAGIVALVASGPAVSKADKADKTARNAALAGSVDPGPSPSADPLSALPSAISDGPSISVLVPLMMLAIAVLFGGIAWVRSRTRRDA